MRLPEVQIAPFHSAQLGSSVRAVQAPDQHEPFAWRRMLVKYREVFDLERPKLNGMNRLSIRLETLYLAIDQIKILRSLPSELRGLVKPHKEPVYFADVTGAVLF